MRLFLAIELPKQARKQLDTQLTELKNKYPQFTWVPSSSYHITVHFFGEVTRVEELIKKIEGALFEAPSISLYSLNVDLFIHRKIVLFIGFYREKKLEEIVKKINSEFLTNEKEKYIPHLTIARTKIPSKQQYFVLKKKLENLPIHIEFPVNKLVLYESILGGKQPVYKPLHTFTLNENK